MSVSVWQQAPGTASTYNCDIAVIGAGIIGSYTAYTLAQAGRKVALLETRFPAAGATGRNAGFCLMGAADNYATGVDQYGREKARSLWELTRENQRKTRQFVEKFKTFFIPCGSAILGIDEAESALLARAYELMREDSIEVSYSPTDPFERGFGSAVIQPNDFGLDPLALVNAFIENAGPNLQFFAPAEVFAIQRTNENRLLVEARGVNVLCDQVALCTNAFSPLIAPYFNDKVAPTRGQLFITAPLSRRVMDKLAYANYGYEYFRQLPDGSFMLGGGRSPHKALEVGYDEVPTSWVQATLEEFLQKYFPDVAAEVPIVRRWAGIMGFSVDGLPLVGQLPYVPGTFAPITRPFAPASFQPDLTPADPAASQIYFAVGFTGHGMGWGIMSADLMIDQMLGQRNDGGLFDVRRLSPAQV